MSNFLYLFRGGDEEFGTYSPEERQAHMQKWGVYMGGLKEKGQLVDGLPPVSYTHLTLPTILRV